MLFPYIIKTLYPHFLEKGDLQFDSITSSVSFMKKDKMTLVCNHSCKCFSLHSNYKPRFIQIRVFFVAVQRNVRSFLQG